MFEENSYILITISTSTIITSENTINKTQNFSWNYKRLNSFSTMVWIGIIRMVGVWIHNIL